MKTKFAYLIIISIILFTPIIYSTKLFFGLITAKQLFFYCSVAILLLIYSYDYLSSKDNISFNYNIIDATLLLFYISFLIRAVYTKYTPLIYNTKFLNISTVVLLYFVIKSKFSHSLLNLVKNDTNIKESNVSNNNHFLTEVVIIQLMISGLIQAVWGLLQLYGIAKSFHILFKITGTFFNPAPYSVYLAGIFPLALANVLLRNKNQIAKSRGSTTSTSVSGAKQKFRLYRIMGFQIFNPYKLLSLFSYIISILTMGAILLVLPATMNRASWIAITIGSLFIFNIKYNLIGSIVRYTKTSLHKFVVAIILILLISNVAAGLYFLKRGSSNSRLLIWEITIGKVFKKPLCGYGVGRFEAEYNMWQSEYFSKHPVEREGLKGISAGNIKYCYNEYLEIISELGIIGFLFFIIFVSVVLFKIYKITKLGHQKCNIPLDYRFPYSRNELFSYNKYDISITLILSPSIISLLTCAAFSIPFYCLPCLLVFFLILALISSKIGGWNLVNKNKLKQSNSFIINLIPLAIFTTISILLIFLTVDQYKALKKCNMAVMLSQSERYEEACESYAEIYKSMRFSGPFLLYYGKALNLNQNYQKSAEILEYGKHFTSDEILYVTLGDTYQRLSRYSEAEEAYQFASNIIPNKLYPLYLLANLYIEMEQNEKAIRTAKYILNMKIKVNSMAIQEIQQKMKRFLEECKTSEEFQSIINPTLNN